MTDPIQRAIETLAVTQAYVFGVAFGVPAEADESHARAIAAAVFESIDIDDLAHALHAAECAPKCPRDVGDTDKRYAQAMKAHLTGKDQQ